MSTGRFPAVGDAFGRYHLVRLLGSGGMGMVFEARDDSLQRSVALKVLLPTVSSDPDLRARFGAEATALARLDSPHVVRVYEHGEHDGCLYIATQLVSDGDLRQHLDAHGPLAPADAAAIVEQVCEALADAHRAGIVHRDVKASNVLLQRRTDGMHAYLSDFGIATPVSDGRTLTGIMVGSVHAMAPELHEGARADVRSDVYAAGCLLVHLLTGRHVYEGSDLQVAMAHVHDDLPALDVAGAEGLDAVVRRSLAKDPADRYPDADQMRAALRGWRAGHAGGQAPAAAVVDGSTLATTTRAGTPTRSLRRASVLVGVGVVALLAVLGLSLPMLLTDDTPGPIVRATLVTAGGSQTCALDEDAAAWCWGWNEQGTLGDGTTENRSLAVEVDAEPGWVDLSTGFDTTCGVRDDGTAACWGPPEGEVRELPGTGWTSVVVRQLHACGTREGGEVWCWGQNTLGQLGDGSTEDSAEPVQVPGDDWTEVQVGQSHTCALKVDRSLWCWGGNDFGQLGDGTTEPSATPVQVPGQGWATLSTRAGHTCGVRDDGTGWCWGLNEQGQVGDGTTAKRLSPTQVPGEGWDYLKTGGKHTCGFKQDRTIWCWGSNEFGQLGDGTITPSVSPVRVAGSLWRGVVVGHSHTCGMKDDGGVWCWGRNHYGQLGDGTIVNRRAPVPAQTMPS